MLQMVASAWTWVSTSGQCDWSRNKLLLPRKFLSWSIGNFICGTFKILSSVRRKFLSWFVENFICGTSKISSSVHRKYPFFSSTGFIWMCFTVPQIGLVGAAYVLTGGIFVHPYNLLNRELCDIYLHLFASGLLIHCFAHFLQCSAEYSFFVHCYCYFQGCICLLCITDKDTGL